MVFFLGIKGVAMANIASFLKKMGKDVYGVDVKDEFITDKLLKENEIFWSTDFNFLPEKTDLVVYSAAHQGINNPLVQKAIKKNIKVISQAELLGELMSQFKIKIAVSGCHGKTTTSSLLSYALEKLDQKPSYIVGTPFFTDYQGSNFQEKKYFVVEADEYGINPPVDKTPKFLKLHPDWIITTNIDFDHPDVYENIEKVKEAFIKFFNNRKIIVNLDDKNLKDVVKKSFSKKIITYGFSDQVDYRINSWKIDQEGSDFQINKLGKFRISLFGKHNIANAAAVIVQLLQLGFKVNEIKKAIEDFQGAKRRFELLYKKNNFYLFDDYAHHPKEIESTIKAARERFPNKKIIVIFQPHTFSRTLSLFSDFKKSLALADMSFILPIFASARENKDQFKISSKDIADNKKIFYFDSKEELSKKLKNSLQKNEVVFTMGAGDIYKLKDTIVNLI